MIKDIEHFSLCLLIIPPHTHTQRKHKKLRQIQCLNIKPRAINLLEENTEYFYDLVVMGGIWQGEGQLEGLSIVSVSVECTAGVGIPVPVSYSLTYTYPRTQHLPQKSKRTESTNSLQECS